MKKNLIALLALAFLGTSLTFPAVGAPKAGTACPKVGKMSSASGKTFTCIKSGKKKIWDKGISTGKPAKQPKPASSSASEVITPRTPTMPTSFADLEENYQGIPYAVWEKIQSNLALHKSTDLKINFLFGPNTPQRYPNQWSIDALTLGSRVMGAQKQPAEAQFVQYNKQDVPWARTEAEKYISPFRLGISFPDQAAEKCSGADCDGGVTNIANDIALILVGVSTPVNRYAIQRFNGQNDLHEYAHAVQGMAFKGKVTNPPPMHMPCWYSEGQPQAISIPTMAKSAEDYVTIRKGWVTDNRWVLKDYEPESIQEFLQKNMKVPCDPTSYGMVFHLGYIVMDALVAVGGIDKTFDVLTSIADGVPFEESFKKTYGIAWSEASVVLSKVASKVYKEYRK